MKKILSGIIAASFVFCCSAADPYETLMKEGNAARQKKDYAAAVAAYQKAFALPVYPSRKYAALYQEEECLKSQKKYDEAIAVMLKAPKVEKLTPSAVAEAYYICAQLALQKKDPQAASGFFEKSAKIGEGWASARSLSNHGDLLRNQKKYAEAEKLYKEALKYKEAGSRQEAYIGLALLYYNTGKDFDTAMAPLLEAEKEAAKLADFHQIRVIYYKVVIYYDYKKGDEAVSEAMKLKKYKNPQKEWAASAYSAAANAAFVYKKDVKTAKELIAESAKLNATWGHNRDLQKKLEAMK